MTGEIKRSRLQGIFQWCFSTHHGRIVTLGIITGLIFYVPAGLEILIKTVSRDNKSTILLNIGLLALGLSQYWQRREELSNTTSTGEDRLTGHLIILGCIPCLVILRDLPSLQSLTWMLTLVGIAWSSFGIYPFKVLPLASLMILTSMYPNPAALVSYLWYTLTPPQMLESFTAQIGSMALQLIGQSAIAKGSYIVLPTGAVEVASGCTGFDMAFEIAACSFLLGLFMKQKGSRIILAMLAGIVFALVLNIPRIMLLVFAAVYWGQDSFHFWHGPWGGQIFAAIIFTLYYYILMAIYRAKSKTRKTA